MSNQNNIINDLGTLLHLPAKATSELVDKACLCISSAIKDAKDREEKQITLNIGIGFLGIDLVNMQCKFVPSKNLKGAIKQALTSEINPLEAVLEKAFADKLIAICEEVL